MPAPHRNEEFVAFLKLIDRSVPKRKQIHLIVDNYGTHTHPNVVEWLSRHPRFHLHFTPTSSSWLNLVERWFRELATKRLQRGSFASVPELIEAIEAYIEHHTPSPSRLCGPRPHEEIIEKVRRGRVALDQPRVI